MKELKTKIIAMAFSSSELLRKVRETGSSLSYIAKSLYQTTVKPLETCLLGHFH